MSLVRYRQHLGIPHFSSAPSMVGGRIRSTSQRGMWHCDVAIAPVIRSASGTSVRGAAPGPRPWAVDVETWGRATGGPQLLVILLLSHEPLRREGGVISCDMMGCSPEPWWQTNLLQGGWEM